MIGVRMAPHARSELEKWASDQPDAPTLSEAIRRLVEIGLAAWLDASVSTQPLSPRARSKAAELASKTIERRADPSATPEEHASRKRRLLKGPREFRGIRKDHPE